jgi:hypothetical protein
MLCTKDDEVIIFEKDQNEIVLQVQIFVLVSKLIFLMINFQKQKEKSLEESIVHVVIEGFSLHLNTIRS